MENLDGKFDITIVDEAHYLKNPMAVRTKNILGGGDGGVQRMSPKKGLIHNTDRMWFLTGTPTPNHAAELWPFLYVTGRTELDYMTFIRKFCNSFQANYGLQVTGTKTDATALKELNEMLDGFMLRRTEKEVAIELPSLFTTLMEVEPQTVKLNEAFPELLKLHTVDQVKELLEKELNLYNQIVNGNMSHMLIDTLKANAQSLSTLRRYTALQKMQGLVDLVTDELTHKAYEKVVIFCIHSTAAKGIAKRLSEFNPAIVIGETTNKAAEVERFQNDDQCHIFIGNINAAGTSINLSAANQIFFLEESWVPGENEQAIMRCGGPTQKQKNIFVRICMAAKNEVDLKVHTSLERKASEVKRIYETQKSALGELLE